MDKETQELLDKTYHCKELHIDHDKLDRVLVDAQNRRNEYYNRCLSALYTGSIISELQYNKFCIKVDVKFPYSEE